MRENQLYFAFAAAESPAAATEFFAADLTAENYMLERSKFLAACKQCNIVPWVDICADMLGTNSLCPFHLSPIQDSSKTDLHGWPVWCNPPYKSYEAIVRNIEAGQTRDGGTAAVLILPVKDEVDDLLQALTKENCWAVELVWSLSAKDVFTGADAAHPLHEKRTRFQNPVQAIGVFKLLAKDRHAGHSLEAQLTLHRDALRSG